MVSLLAWEQRTRSYWWQGMGGSRGTSSRLRDHCACPLGNPLARRPRETHAELACRRKVRAAGSRQEGADGWRCEWREVVAVVWQ